MSTEDILHSTPGEMNDMIACYSIFNGNADAKEPRELWPDLR
jgi:hypothetical protein